MATKSKTRSRSRSRSRVAKKAEAPIDAVKRYLSRLSRSASAKRKDLLRSARNAMERLYGR